MRGRDTLRRSLALLAAAAVGAAGCGGGDGDAAGADESAARAAYIRQGDALCRDIMGYLDGEFVEELDRLNRQAERSGDLDRFFARYARLLEEAADRTARHVERFAALEPPADSEEVHAGIVGALRAQQYLSRREVNAYRERDFDRAEALCARIEQLDERIERVVRDYGFVDCARPG